MFNLLSKPVLREFDFDIDPKVVHIIALSASIYYSGPRLIWPPRARQNVATITGGMYYPEFSFSKKSKFLYKSGHINGLDILSVDILSGVYCIPMMKVHF